MNGSIPNSGVNILVYNGQYNQTWTCCHFICGGAKQLLCHFTFSIYQQNMGLGIWIHVNNNDITLSKIYVGIKPQRGMGGKGKKNSGSSRKKRKRKQK